MEVLPVGSGGGRAFLKRGMSGDFAAGGVVAGEFGEGASVQVHFDAYADFEDVTGAGGQLLLGKNLEFVFRGGGD